MTRVAVVRDSDLAIRPSDDERLVSIRGAVADVGHELVDAGDAEVVIVALSSGTRGLAERIRPAVPVVVVIDRATSGGRDESDRSFLESDADGYVIDPRHLGAAISWLTAEDRAARGRGQPRLTVVGSRRGDDLGMARSLLAEPTVIGRAMTFSQHPQRPDRMPTPTNTIARHHARVRCLDGVIAVSDMRSTNGTLVIRWGEPARLLVPQQAQSGREFGPPATSWLVRDPTGDWVELRIGDHLQLPGFWRFRVDGDPAWQPDD